MTSILTGVMVSGMEMEDNCTMDRGLKCKSNTLLVPGSTYTVKSRCKNGKYPRKEKCSWRFNFHGCKPVISCDYIMTRKGKGKRCKGGDKLIMSSSVGWGFETVFCGKKKNTTVTPVHASDIAAEQDYLDIKFSANRKKKGKRGRGFQCQVTCEEPAEPSGDYNLPAEPISDCRCGVANRADKTDRIVGGIETEKNEYPWQVGITWTDRTSPFCGGSVLSTRTILTAAHCVENKTTLLPYLIVVVGEHDFSIQGDGEKRMSVCGFAMHPNYYRGTYDIAILTLCEDIIFTKEIAPVCPPALPDSDYASLPAISTGWGRLSLYGPQPKKLMEVELITLTKNVCTKYAYGSLYKPEIEICAIFPEKGICKGDSGGPLVTDEGGYYSQIGVASWFKTDCAHPGHPSVYARITTLVRFIRENISGATCPPPK